MPRLWPYPPQLPLSSTRSPLTCRCLPCLGRCRPRLRRCCRERVLSPNAGSWTRVLRHSGAFSPCSAPSATAGSRLSPRAPRPTAAHCQQPFAPIVAVDRMEVGKVEQGGPGALDNGLAHRVHAGDTGQIPSLVRMVWCRADLPLGCGPCHASPACSSAGSSFFLLSSSSLAFSSFSSFSFFRGQVGRLRRWRSFAAETPTFWRRLVHLTLAGRAAAALLHSSTAACCALEQQRDWPCCGRGCASAPAGPQSSAAAARA